jgi:hypothetical protein
MITIATQKFHKLLLPLLFLIIFTCAPLPAQEKSADNPDSWSSDMWEKHKGAISIGGAVLFIILSIVLLRHQSNARAAKMEAYAQTRGWEFVHHDDGELNKLLKTLCPGWDYWPFNIRQVQVRGPRMLMFEVVFQDPMSVKPKPLPATACLVELARNEPGRPQVVIYRYAHRGDNEVNFDDAAFAQEFSVSSEDSMAALRIVSPDVRQALLKHLKLVDDAFRMRFEVNAGYLFTVTEGLRDLTDEEDMDSMLAVTLEVAAAINAQTR